jgi:hypothetical protein
VLAIAVEMECKYVREASESATACKEPNGCSALWATVVSRVVCRSCLGPVDAFEVRRIVFGIVKQSDCGDYGGRLGIWGT